MSIDTQAVVLRYNDTPVLFDPVTKMGSLTAMWHAYGSPEHKRPADWLRTAQAQEVIAALEQREGLVGNFHLVRTQQRGANPGTWAHRQLATIYAHYLNPDFYLAWNQFVFDVLEGKHPTLAIEQRLAMLESEVAALKRSQITALPSSDIPTLADRPFDAHALITVWWERYAGNDVHASDIHALAGQHGIVLPITLGDDMRQKQSVGRLLVRWRNHIIDGKQIIYAGFWQHARHWRLVQAE